MPKAIFTSALLQPNKCKNRFFEVLPYELTRVALTPIRGIDGSDYINANFVDSYRSRHAYIATQGPLAETLEDFWRMIWEHNSAIIVMLSQPTEQGKVSGNEFNSLKISITQTKVKFPVLMIETSLVKSSPHQLPSQIQSSIVAGSSTPSIISPCHSIPLQP